MQMQSQNPATGELLAEFEKIDFEAAKIKTRACRDAQMKWRMLSVKERTVPFKKLAHDLGKEARTFGMLATLEMGKPIKQAQAEVEKCALLCDYYAEHAAEQLQSEVIQTDAQKSYARFDPLGILLAVMPWNFPYWQVFRAAIPALAAGNGVVLKHASNVPQCALQIEKIFIEAGFPEHIFQTLLIDAETANFLIARDEVDCVTLTGSTRAGSQIGENAGRHIKKAVLELGGSDPFIVFSDADLDLAAKNAVTARNQNAGQSCIAAKRFLVEADVMKKFQTKLIEGYGKLKVGDPAKEETDMGPLAKKEFRDEISELVNDATAKGATVLFGGKAIDGPGWFYQPTILSDVTAQMRVYREEVFGPVLTLIPFTQEQEAIEVANGTEFGLGASLWTQNRDRGERLAAQIEAGGVFINAMVKSDPRLPFGGIKKSGIGRELGSYGIREFVNIKTVVVY